MPAVAVLHSAEELACVARPVAEVHDANSFRKVVSESAFVVIATREDQFAYSFLQAFAVEACVVFAVRHEFAAFAVFSTARVAFATVDGAVRHPLVTKAFERD